MLTIDEQKFVIRTIADDLGELRDDYSGRGMFGKTCYGIVTDNPDGCIEEAAEEGIKGARRDSMGLKHIVYWPHIPGDEQ
jgi:hypothetical protein